MKSSDSGVDSGIADAIAATIMTTNMKVQQKDPKNKVTTLLRSDIKSAHLLNTHSDFSSYSVWASCYYEKHQV